MGIIFKIFLAAFLLMGMVLLLIGIRIKKKEQNKTKPSIKSTIYIASGAFSLLIFLCGVCFFLYSLSSNFEKRKTFKKQFQGSKQNEQQQGNTPKENYRENSTKTDQVQETKPRRQFQEENQKLKMKKQQ